MNRIEIEHQCLQNMQKLSVSKLIKVLDFVQLLQNTTHKTKKIPLGLLKGKLKVYFEEDFKITDEEFLNL